MIYRCTKDCPPDPLIIINELQVPWVHEVIHLGISSMIIFTSSALLNVLKILINSQIFFLQI